VAADLAAGVAKLRDQNLDFSLGDGIDRADGQWDAAAGAASLSRVIDGYRSAVVVIGNDIYLSGMVPDGAVLHLAADQIPQGSRLLPEAVPGKARAHRDQVQRSGPSSPVADLSRADLSGSVILRRLVDYLFRGAGDWPLGSSSRRPDSAGWRVSGHLPEGGCRTGPAI
jgi:hypothetical protein